LLLQVDRFQSTQRLLVDYFAWVQGGLLPEANPWSLALASQDAAGGKCMTVAPPLPHPILFIEVLLWVLCRGSTQGCSWRQGRR
jgi:hypothetical protein